MPGGAPPPTIPPGTALVLYDGDCGLCRRSVRWLLARDRRGRLRFAPLQGETAKALGVAEAKLVEGRPVAPDSILLLEPTPDGQLKLHDRAVAVARALLVAGGASALLGRALLLVPRPLADGVYRFVAARRHRLGAPRCELPADRTRFLP